MRKKKERQATQNSFAGKIIIEDEKESKVNLTNHT